MVLLKRNVLFASARRCYVAAVKKQTDSTIDEADVNRFEKLSQASSEWMNEKSGAFKALHSFNRLRVPWIAAHLTKDVSGSQPLDGVRILDVGSGGGLLSMALCRLGADVVGLDASTSAVRIADVTAGKTLRADVKSRLRFVNSSIEEFAVKNKESFDAVVASEVVEHVSDLPGFIRSCVLLAKSDVRTPIFFTTINRTMLSRIFAIWMAEDVLSIVPRGVHEWDKFVEPDTLRQLLLDENCRSVSAPFGIAYNPFANSWSWSSFSQINYALVATKN